MPSVNPRTDFSPQASAPVDSQSTEAPPVNQRPTALGRVIDAVEAFAGSNPPPSAARQSAAGHSQAATESMNAVRQALGGGLFHWVDDRDLAQVHHALEALGPAEYRATLGTMDQEGLLTRYLGKLEPQAREAFLTQATRKELVEVSPGAKTRGKLCPPDSPPTFRNDPKLPPPVRDAIYAHARAAARAYCHEFKSYLGRYQQAVKNASAGADLRALGEVAPLNVPADGMVYGHPDYRKNSGSWLAAGEYPTQAGAQRAVSDKLADLLGEARPGSVSLEASASLKVAGSTAKLEGGISGSGKVDGKGVLGQEASLGPVTLEVTADTNGQVGVVETMRLGSVELAHAASSNGGFKHQAKISGTGVSFDSSGRAKVSMGSGYAYANPTRGEFGGGVKLERKLGEGKLKLELGAGLNTLSQAAATHALALANPGVFGTPAELTRGLRWEELPEASARMHRRNGWTAQEWASKLRSP